MKNIRFHSRIQSEYKARWYVLMITMGLWIWYLGMFAGLSGIGSLLLFIGGLAHLSDSRVRIKKLKHKLKEINGNNV